MSQPMKTPQTIEHFSARIDSVPSTPMLIYRDEFEEIYIKQDQPARKPSRSDSACAVPIPGGLANPSLLVAAHVVKVLIGIGLDEKAQPSRLSPQHTPHPLLRKILLQLFHPLRLRSPAPINRRCGSLRS